MTARYTSKTRRLSAGAAAASRRATCKLGGGLVEQAVEDAVDRERGREISVAQMGIGREHPEQRVERLAAPVHRQREVVVHEQARGRRPVTGCLIVADGFDDVAARCSCQAAAARCSDGIVAGATRRSSRRSRSANRWW